MNVKIDQLEDPQVKAAIRLLQAKGITIKEIEQAYLYYARIKEKPVVKKITDWI